MPQHEHAVTVMVEGKALGEVTVLADADCDAVQVAATAREAVLAASFVVAGEEFNATEIMEWWA